MQRHHAHLRPSRRGPARPGAVLAVASGQHASQGQADCGSGSGGHPARYSRQKQVAKAGTGGIGGHERHMASHLQNVAVPIFKRPCRSQS
ncbi:hypothetical protein BV133_2498 [Blastochloris viridis]|uniref:Uncharacterized protein n=1 Tax=Blastochloris viridis TaxID=1079 RepID=A0A182D5B0_BLAVI|nr:hypothetical protein BV133_2498 [Blastochloris viridis]